MSKERVLRAAIILADEGGIESLSMRKLGRELGVEAMSLYTHVANKAEILDGMVDIVANEIDVRSSGADWKTAMRQTAISAHEVLLRHPWACSLWMSRTNFGPARLRYIDAVLGSLRKAGFSTEMTYYALHVLHSHILGFTLQEVNFLFDTEELEEPRAIFLRELPTDRYPYLADHVMQHLTEPGHEYEGDFEFGLDMILDGLERVRDTA